MKIATQRIAYWIACYKREELVSGEALALPPPFNDLRFCVRRSSGEWVIDHYDTGMGMIGPVLEVGDTSTKNRAYMERWQRDGKTKVRVVAWLIRYLLHLHRKRSLLLAHIRAATDRGAKA